MSFTAYLPESVRSRYALKLLGVSLVIVLLIAALTTATVVQVSDRVRNDQLNSVEINTELEARALGQWIDGKQQVVRALSNHKGLAPVSGSQVQATLRAELELLSPEATSLFITERSPGVDSNGTTEAIVASTDEQLVGQPLLATDINWKPTTGFNFDGINDVTLSLVYTDDSETLVTLASPMPDGEHVLLAEYRTSVRAEEFSSAIDGTETLVLGGFTAFVLFDENESSAITPYNGDRTNTTIGRTILRSEPTTDLNGTVLTDTEVKGYYSVPGEKVDWVVVKEVPRSKALGVTSRVQRDLWLLLTVVVAGFFFLGIIIQLGPIRSIKRLAGQANAIAEGNLGVEIDRGGRSDEIGEIRSAFDNTKTYIETIGEQADALSRRAFDEAVLEADVPGRVGESVSAMHQDLQQFITRLEVLNRILRHNLRNQLDVISSHAEALDETAHRRAILAATETLASLGTRARRIDHILSKDTQPTTINLVDRIEAVLDDTETEGVTVTASLVDGTTVVTDGELLTTVLRSPLENAVEYADSRVSVSVESVESGGEITISDDGPGIPASELEPLTAGQETPLEHSRGLGLWELKWAVDKLDGELSFVTDDGTTVVIRLPDLDPDSP